MTFLPLAAHSRAVGTFALLCCLLRVATPGVAHAKDANDYGAPGRTIVSGGVSGYDSNVRTPDPFGHLYTWGLGGSLSLAHFWFRNIALGGTVYGGASHLKDEFVSPGRTASAWFGGDFDAVFHVPISRRFSMRFWLWAGIGWSRTERPQFDRGGYYLGLQGYGDAVWLRAGFTPDPLVHLSPSVALALGPSIDVTQPLDGGDFDYHIRFTPGMSYSFGPDERGSSLEPARLFSARGRTAMTMHFWADSSDVTTGFGLVRFVGQGLGLGAYAGMGFTSSSGMDRDYLNFGVQAMVDVPLRGSLSILLVPKVGYELMRAYPDHDYDQPRVGAHQLELALPVYMAVHLRQGLVLGVGPELVSHLRVQQTAPELANGQYVRGGVSSTITASF